MISLLDLVTPLLPFVRVYGAGGVLIAVAAAVYFLSAFKRLAIALAAGVAIVLVSYSVGVHNGSDYKQAKWDAAEHAAARDAAAARRDAEAVIPPLAEPDPSPPAHGSRGVCNDRYDRDCA